MDPNVSNMNNCDGEDVENEGKAIVDLKEGISLSKLYKTGEASFEIDAESIPKDDFAPLKKIYNTLRPDYLELEEDNGAGEDDVDPDNDARSQFSQYLDRMDKITEDGGVHKRVREQGHGDTVPEGAMVTAHYKAYNEYSDQPYDSSKYTGRPYKWRLGVGRLIVGLEVALLTMRAGETSHFIFSPEYAYREIGCPDHNIPPRAFIFCVIELISFIDSSTAFKVNAMSVEERAEADFTVIYETAKTNNELGNQLVKEKKRDSFRLAAARYEAGWSLLEAKEPENEEQRELKNGMLVRLWLNTALCHLKMNETMKTILFCGKVLKQEEKNVKGLYRRGMAYMERGEYQDAKSDLTAAHNIEPRNTDITKALDRLEKYVEKSRVDEKNMCQKMMKATVREHSSSGEQSSADEEDFEKAVEPDFKDKVDKILEKFIDSKGENIMNVPPGFDLYQMAYVASRCKSLGLEIITKGVDKTLIYKPKA